MQQFAANPELIEEMIEVIDGRDMPPEDEPQLDDSDREKLLASLKSMLRASVANAPKESIRGRVRRLNRFQYNNSVRDLFGLNRDVFPLSEKLMTRHSDYLRRSGEPMPDAVDVSCRALDPEPGLADVRSFPKDLRAAHGFDNQANQLTLSPLLLDSFLRLSVSILESADFNEGTVGIWNDFFRAPPAESNLKDEIRNRLEPFLRQAFRSPVEPETLERYTAYTLAKIEGEDQLRFTAAMKKVASAVLSSPMFLYRYESEQEGDDSYELASRLSFFLWGSSPDAELLKLAASGDLTDREVLDETVTRMLASPKIERFLDTFPTQWMQLENTLAATPDPRKARFFSIDPQRPAGTQMVLEPLLLFDSVFVENRPIGDLISPGFGYQSDFLKTWYTSDLKAPKVDAAKLAEENRAKDEQRKSLQDKINTTRSELDGLIAPVRAKLLAEKKSEPEKEEPVDLKPLAAWEFDGDLEDSVDSLDLEAKGKVEFSDGMAVLKNNAFLQSSFLPIDLKAKSLEVWVKVHNIDRGGGGVMGIQGQGDHFDTIVIGERKPRHWISGSNGFARTEDFKDSTPEQTPNETLHLVMVYEENGTTTLYRNGQPYGKPYRKGEATFRKDEASVIFGLRHLPPGGNKHLDISLLAARLYNRALNADEVAASGSGNHLYVTAAELQAALDPAQTAKRKTLEDTLRQTEESLKRVPGNIDPNKARQESQRRFDDEMRRKLHAQRFERISSTDPRYGGVITNAAMLSMTSGPKRTHPIARGAWVIEVILNDPPPPPPNDVPPLNEDSGPKNQTIREKFAAHRANPDCAGCHSRLDPLGFALENFDITGRWRDKYENGREVDPSGTLMKRHEFDGVVAFKQSLLKEDRRFAKAFAAHLMRFALARELTPADSLAIEDILERAAGDGFRLKTLIREVAMSERFLQAN